MRSMTRAAVSALATGMLTSVLLASGLVLAEPAAAAACTGNVPGPVSTDQDPAGWVFTDTGPAGHQQWVDGGLRVWTDAGAPGADQQSVGRRLLGGDETNPTIVPLADIGDVSWQITPTSGAEPGLNLTILFGDTGEFAGNLVKESKRVEWWGTRALPGVPPGPSPNQLAFGTLENILAQSERPIVVVGVGFSLGSNAVGDATIHSITANCTTWAFDVVPTPPPPPAPVVVPPPVPEAALVPEAAGEVSVPSTLPAGSQIPVFVGVELAGQIVFVYLYSDPIFLGEFVVDAAGFVNAQAPPGVTGFHRVAVLDQAGALVGWDTVTLTTTNEVPLGATGLDEQVGPGAPLLGAVTIGLTLLVGSLVLALRRLRDQGVTGTS